MSPTGKTIFKSFAACLSAVMAAFASTGHCAVVRTMSDMRIWQTVFDRGAPLSWPWEGAADSATLVFSNRLDGVVSSVVVQRTGGETRGVCPQPSPLGGESIVDVELVQTSGGSEVAREAATLAYFGGAGGGPITVRANPGTREWERVREPRVYAVDPAWRGESGESGYDIAWPVNLGLTIILR